MSLRADEVYNLVLDSGQSPVWPGIYFKKEGRKDNQEPKHKHEEEEAHIFYLVSLSLSLSSLLPFSVMKAH